VRDSRRRIGFFTATVIFSAYLAGCTTAPVPQRSAAAFPELPAVGLSFAEGVTVPSPLDSTVVMNPVVMDGPEWLQRSCTLEITREYFFQGGKRTVTYQLIVGNLKEIVAKPGPVKSSSALGTAGRDQPKFVVRSAGLDPYLVSMADSVPVKASGAWWFSASFLFNGVTDKLSFLEIPEIDSHVRDMGDHVLSEPDVAMQFFPQERFRFVTKLPGYPDALDPAEASAVAALEKLFYQKQGVIKFAQTIPTKKYALRLFWQAGFDKYLKDEYVPGQPLWLYGNLVTFNSAAGECWFFIRDFTLRSAEQSVQDRLAQINQN
jgi:hypothetical protein